MKKYIATVLLVVMVLSLLPSHSADARRSGFDPSGWVHMLDMPGKIYSEYDVSDGRYTFTPGISNITYLNHVQLGYRFNRGGVQWISDMTGYLEYSVDVTGFDMYRAVLVIIPKWDHEMMVNAKPSWGEIRISVDNRTVFEKSLNERQQDELVEINLSNARVIRITASGVDFHICEPYFKTGSSAADPPPPGPTEPGTAEPDTTEPQGPQEPQSPEEPQGPTIPPGGPPRPRDRTNVHVITNHPLWETLILIGVRDHPWEGIIRYLIGGTPQDRGPWRPPGIGPRQPEKTDRPELPLWNPAVAVQSGSVASVRITVILDKFIYEPGGRMKVTVENLPRALANNGAFLAIYEEGAPHEAPLSRQNPGAPRDNLTFTAPLEGDLYEMRLYSSGTVFNESTYVLSVPFILDEHPPVSTLGGISGWAQDDVARGIILGLVPAELWYNYDQPTTRAEFCALAVAVYERINGEITGRVTFSDTNDLNVQKAAFIKVVDGIGNNRFNPSGTLTREQAATMLSRLSDAIGAPFPNRGATFSDSGSVSSWARDAVGRVQAAGIMGGTGGNMFSPGGSYTREQSIATIMRTFDEVRETAQQPLPPPPQTNVNITLTKTGFSPGENVTGTVSGVTQQMINDSAWVALYTIGASHNQYGSWTYVYSDTQTFSLPASQTPGNYEVRFYSSGTNYVDETLLARVPFSVTSSQLQPHTLVGTWERTGYGGPMIYFRAAEMVTFYADGRLYENLLGEWTTWSDIGTGRIRVISPGDGPFDYSYTYNASTNTLRLTCDWNNFTHTYRKVG